jgi:hypothetical protein
MHVILSTLPVLVTIQLIDLGFWELDTVSRIFQRGKNRQLFHCSESGILRNVHKITSSFGMVTLPTSSEAVARCRPDRSEPTSVISCVVLTTLLNGDAGDRLPYRLSQSLRKAVRHQCVWPRCRWIAAPYIHHLHDYPRTGKPLWVCSH